MNRTACFGCLSLLYCFCFVDSKTNWMQLFRPIRSSYCSSRVWQIVSKDADNFGIPSISLSQTTIVNFGFSRHVGKLHCCITSIEKESKELTNSGERESFPDWDSAKNFRFFSFCFLKLLLRGALEKKNEKTENKKLRWAGLFVNTYVRTVHSSSTYSIF